MDGGVRRKYIHYTESSWDVVTLPKELNAEDLYNKIKKMQGMPYDFMGLVGFIIRKVPEEKHKVFCSEFVLTVLGFKEAWRFDPNAMYSIIKGIVDDNVCK